MRRKFIIALRSSGLMTLDDSTRRNSSISAATSSGAPVKVFFPMWTEKTASAECDRATASGRTDAARSPEIPRIKIARTYIHTSRPVMMFANQNTDDRNETHRSLRSDSHSSVHTCARARGRSHAHARSHARTHARARNRTCLRSIAFNGEGVMDD